MHPYVAPSVWKAALRHGHPSYEHWLADTYADQRHDADDEASHAALVSRALETIERTNPEVIVDAIAEHAIEVGSTTNGGHEIYLDDWTSVPWCSESEMLVWPG
ncbi:MAG: hypothetical protein JRD89_03500 [Deltaproteobacteria bacterium]|nr:hypothetical protein [Deltaproteobacteria bacterium]